MSIPFEQHLADSYDAVVAKKAENQWAEASFLEALEAKGGIKRVPGGSTLSFMVDYKKNPGTDILQTDFTGTATSKTETRTKANYEWATAVVPMNWSITDEAKNQEPNQRVEMISGMVDNAMASHDDELEADAFAAAATDGLLSLPVLANETASTGTVGSIPSDVETWWGNQVATYDISDADIEAVLVNLFWKCAKGGGSKKMPTLFTSGITPFLQFSGQLQALQRYGNGDKGVAGFKALQVVTADYVFSKNGGTNVFAMNTDNTKLYAIKGHFRKRGGPVSYTDKLAMNMKIHSVCQFATDNRSRMGNAKSQA